MCARQRSLNSRDRGFLWVWDGTLLQDKLDFSGTMYRRHRQYDPETGRVTQEDPIGLAGGLSLYGYAGGDPVTYSDPLGSCPYSGDKRDANLGDCPSDKIILPAFKLMQTNALGRAFIQVFAAKHLELRAHSGKVTCGGHTAANACMHPFTFAIEFNSKMSVADRAHAIVHETMHAVNAQTWLDNPLVTPAIDEEWAEAAGYTFLNSLPEAVRKTSIYSGMAEAYRKDPQAELRRGCQSEGLADCP